MNLLFLLFEISFGTSLTIFIFLAILAAIIEFKEFNEDKHRNITWNIIKSTLLVGLFLLAINERLENNKAQKHKNTHEKKIDSLTNLINSKNNIIKLKQDSIGSLQDTIIEKTDSINNKTKKITLQQVKVIKLQDKLIDAYADMNNYLKGSSDYIYIVPVIDVRDYDYLSAPNIDLTVFNQEKLPIYKLKITYCPSDITAVRDMRETLLRNEKFKDTVLGDLYPSNSAVITNVKYNYGATSMTYYFIFYSTNLHYAEMLTISKKKPQNQYASLSDFKYHLTIYNEGGQSVKDSFSQVSAKRFNGIDPSNKENQ